jgi:hypothetical protein
MKNLFLIIGLSFFILNEGFSQVIAGPVAGATSLHINGIQIKRDNKYTHPVANQNIVLGSTLYIYPGVFDDLNLIVAYVYKNGSLIKNISQGSGINYSFAPVSFSNSFPYSMYLTLVIPCDDPSYGPGNYWINFQYEYISIYDYNHYTGTATTITGTVDAITPTANLCGNYTGSTTMSASSITNCSYSTLQNGSHTTLAASQSIVFSPGFISSSGSSMHAMINNGCISAGSLARIANTTSIDEVSELPQNSNTKAYPNPTTGILNIPINNYSKNGSTIYIYNTLGEEIYLENIAVTNSPEIVNVNLSNYSAGIYMLKVVSSDNISLQQIILEK